MKRLFTLAIIALMLVSCNSTSTTPTVPGSSSPESTQAPAKTTAPATKPAAPSSTNGETVPPASSDSSSDDDYGIGGDVDSAYRRPLSLDLAVDPTFGEMAGMDRYTEWKQQFSHINPNGTRDPYEYNLYTLITELNVSEQMVRDFCREFKEDLDQDYLPEQVIDWIFEGNKAAVYQYYLLEGSFLVGDRFFYPKWLVEHTAEEYLEAGLTSEILEENLGKVLAACETEEQRTAITSGQIQLQKLELENQ